jgi:hypothetical protein
VWNDITPTKKDILNIHLQAQSATFGPEPIDSANFFFFQSPVSASSTVDHVGDKA